MFNWHLRQPHRVVLTLKVLICILSCKFLSHLKSFTTPVFPLRTLNSARTTRWKPFCWGWVYLSVVEYCLVFTWSPAPQHFFKVNFFHKVRPSFTLLHVATQWRIKSINDLTKLHILWPTRPMCQVRCTVVALLLLHKQLSPDSVVHRREYIPTIVNLGKNLVRADHWP